VLIRKEITDNENRSSNSCVSTEEFFEEDYEYAGIWEEAIMDYPIICLGRQYNGGSPKKVFRRPGLERVSVEHKSLRHHAL
jgi:hypothetical protein